MHELTVLLLLHVGQCKAGQEIHAVHALINGLFPCILMVIIDLASAVEVDIAAGIVDENVHAAVFFFDLLEDALAVFLYGNIAADEDLFLYYSYLGYTTDLRTVLSAQQLAALQPHLHYVDGKLLEQQENSEGGLSFAYGDCPDPKKPEAMTDPIPVGIDLSAATQAFRSSYTFSSDVPVLGLCVSSANPGIALSFLQYALGLPVTAPDQGAK